MNEITTQIESSGDLSVSIAEKNTMLMEKIFQFSYELKRERLRQKYPDWNQEQLHAETMRLFDIAATRL